MKILVTGAHGLLGRCLLLQRQADLELVGCGRSAEPVAGRPCHAVDLGDPRAVATLVRQVRPDWVIHTAALTSVDQCETEPELARHLNVDLVANVAQACRAAGSGLVHLSTDYVFDGAAGPYAEGDPPRPLSSYGRLKLASETVALEAGVPALVIRTLWLYGHVTGARRNLVTWPLEALSRGERLRIVDDQWGNPTCARDLAGLLLDLCRQGTTGLFHVGGATFLTRYELVLELADRFGLERALVEPMSTAAAAQAAPRPLRSGLRSEAVTTALGRRPLSLAEGLQRLRQEEDFRRDFPDLAKPPPR
ncbi:MAG: dTDP-4-dehydrorhamnose reductase [Gemmatimonadota bacterium]